MKILNIKGLQLTLAFWLFSFFGYGQFKTDLSPMNSFHSSNATTLGSFGDVPVSLYTGTPNISVPIHKLNERGVELDINLEYNAKGVRVDDVPGWVGQNWALNAGGVITRTVRGTAFDELNFFHGKNINQTITPYLVEWSTSLGGGKWYPGIFQRGYFYHKEKLNTTNWDTYSNLYNLASSSYLNFPLDRLEQNWRMDLEPDLFTFNFMGHSGHFFLGQDGQWKVFSNSNLKVVCNLDTDISYLVPAVPAAGLDGISSNPFMIRYPKVINKITLIDDLGNKYLFDQVELTFNSITSQRPPYNNDSRCISSAFYITKVTDINNNILYEFEYEKGPWQGKFSVSQQLNQSSPPNEINNTVSNTAIYTYDPIISIDWSKYGFQAPGQLILPSYLKKIKSESGIEIDFNSVLVQNAIKYTRGGNSLFDNRDETIYGTSNSSNDMYFLFKETDLITDSSLTPYYFSSIWNRIKNKKLINIKIKDNSNNTVDVNFDFIDTSGVRLFLAGLNFNGTKKYKFDYIGYFNLTGFLELTTDRLGYHNDKAFKFTMNKNDINYWTYELPLLKETNLNVLNGSLYKITYPTGGYTQFDFEPHTYSKKVNDDNILVPSNGIIGGLRIKKITNSFNNTIETKEYLYQKSISNTSSSGNLIYNPIYYKYSGIINHPILNSSLNYRKLYSLSINSLTSMSNFMGTQLEYSDVIEKTTGNGYTHYKYSNYEDFPDINSASTLHSAALPFAPKTDRSYERGSLKEKSVYKENGVLLQKNEFKYYAQNSLLVNAINVNFGYYVTPTIGVINPQLFWMLPFATTYQIPYSDKYLVEENSSTYNSDGTILSRYMTNKYIRYPDSGGAIINNGSIFRKTEYSQSSENGFGILKTFQYPFESSNSVTNTMVNKNQLKIIGEKTEKIEGDPLDPNSSENLTEKKLDYQLVYNSVTSDNTPLPKESFYKKGNNDFEKEFIYSKYDNKGNIIEYRKEDGITVSIIWGYKLTKPIAILENVLHANIPQSTIDNLSNLSNLDTDNGVNGVTENTLRIALNSLRTTFPYAMIKTFTYDPLLETTSITEYNNQIKYFEYDDLSRLKRIRNNEGKILKEYEYNYNPNNNPED